MDGEFEGYDRVTAILDFFCTPDLLSWKVRVGAKEARRIGTIAKNIGSNVDESIKADVTGLKVPKLKSEEAKSCFEAYLRWKEDYQPKLRVGERIFCEESRVCGEPDLFWDDTVIDIKCASEIRPTYWLQTEWYGRKSGMANKAILRLDKNLAMYSYKKMSLSDDDWAAFDGAIKLYRFYNKSEYARRKEEV